MTNKKELINIIDRPWSYNDVEYWTNPKDKCCNAVIIFNEKRSRLRAGILIVKDDEILLGEEEDQPGEFSIPGGGLNKDETPIDAAKREAQEEVFITVKNAQDTNYDYCETNTEVVKWVKDNVPEKKWWYNYYTCLVIAEYDSDYMGNVDKVDLDKSMKASSRWYKIKDVINKPGFKKQWKKALINFGYYKADFMTEDLKDDAKKYFGTTSNWKLGFYINTDGTILDGSGKLLGGSGTTRSIDHREIADILPDGISGTDAMIEYMNDGNIRFMPEAPSFNLIKEPTDEQYQTMSLLISKFRDEFVIEIDDSFGDEKEYFEYAYPTQHAIADIRNYFKPLTEDYKTVYDTIDVYVADRYYGGGWNQEIPVIDHNITKSINDYRRTLGWNRYSIDYLGPHKTHSMKDEKKGFTQLSLFEESLLNEDNRNTLISKSRNAGLYRGDTSRGKNRFERKKYSKVANYVKQYNNLDMNDFFKKDILLVKVPVTGESQEYQVSIKLNGVCAEIAKNIKSNNNKLEFRTIIQALTKIFNTTDVYVNCTCPDYKYRFAHWNIVNNVSTDDTAHDPGPGKGIRNPLDDKGRGCKHVLLVLNNGDWMLKVASVINNYIHYAEEHMQKPFLNIIFPKLYGVAANEMVTQGLVDEDKFLDSSTGVIDAINAYGANRGKYKPGTNKNPVTGTGGRTPNPAKPVEEKEETK